MLAELCESTAPVGICCKGNTKCDGHHEIQYLQNLVPECIVLNMERITTHACHVQTKMTTNGQVISALVFPTSAGVCLSRSVSLFVSTGTPLCCAPLLSLSFSLSVYVSFSLIG